MTDHRDIWGFIYNMHNAYLDFYLDVQIKIHVTI